MVQFTSLAVCTLLAISTVLAAPLSNRQITPDPTSRTYEINRSHMGSTDGTKPTDPSTPVNGTLSSDPSNGGKHVHAAAVHPTNGTAPANVVDSGKSDGTKKKHHTSTNTTTATNTGTNTTSTLCDSGLTSTNNTRKAQTHHKDAKGNKNAATGGDGHGDKNKTHHHKGNDTTTGCTSLTNGTTSNVDNTTSIDNTTSVVNSHTTVKTSKIKTADAVAIIENALKKASNTVNSGRGARAYRWLRSGVSRTPKRRLEPVPLWDTEDE